MRLPYASPTPTPPTAAIYARISARRAPGPLTALDLTLLHAPAVADGWNGFLGAVRAQTSLPPALLELAVCRVAALNGAVYEWDHHAPLALRAGVSPAALETARRVGVEGGEGAEERDGDGGLGVREWAVLDYVDQMTRCVRVDDAVFGRLRAVLVDREVVEMTAVVAAYNCVSRFLVALDVGERNGAAIGSVGESGQAVHT